VCNIKAAVAHFVVRYAYTIQAFVFSDIWIFDYCSYFYAFKVARKSVCTDGSTEIYSHCQQERWT